MYPIGLDYHQTISAHPKLFKKLATALMAQGSLVYIVTAVQRHRTAIVKDLVKKSKVPHTGLEIVVYEDYDDIPQLKLQACKRLGVRLLFDDNPATCKLLKEHGILAVQV